MDNFGEALAAMRDMKQHGVVSEAARTRKRLERVAALLDEGNVDQALLKDVLQRYPPAAIQRLREGKRNLHRQRVAMSLAEKVRQVVELQKIHVAVVGRRRTLRPLERVWDLGKR